MKDRYSAGVFIDSEALIESLETNLLKTEKEEPLFIYPVGKR
ncbi:MAG: hypothetical protein ACQEQC_01005 [Elusimicrobiota bacterium]